jgi:Homeodomain-like domain
MEKRYVVELAAAERQQLEEILRKGRASRFRQTRARLFLKADEGGGGPGWTDAKICEAFDLSPSTVLRARKQLVEEGLEAALERKSSPRPDQRVLDGVQEARLIALACGPPPEGRAQWTLRLLADRMVVLDHDLDHLSHETVRKTLKKTSSSPT